MRWADRHAHRRTDRVRLTGRQWLGLVVFAAVAVVVAFGVGPVREPHPVPAAQVDAARRAFGGLRVIGARPPHDSGYQREAFGSAWTDDTQAAGAGNGCDTRNDILARDVRVSGLTSASTCPRAVAAGVLTSPYTGRPVVFERGRGSSAIQIDHIVPLSYAWDMGASRWDADRRATFANDPSNLVAVDGASNQTKSDAEPARWMPTLRSFHCQYAVQFVTVLARYGLPVDAPSKTALGRALESC